MSHRLPRSHTLRFDKLSAQTGPRGPDSTTFLHFSTNVRLSTLAFPAFGIYQRPSEPLGAPLGYRAYFRTLLDVFFCHLGSTLASHGGPFWKPLGFLFLSWGLQKAKMGGFWEVCFQLHFLNDFWYYFGWVLDVKNLDFA